MCLNDLFQFCAIAVAVHISRISFRVGAKSCPVKCERLETFSFRFFMENRKPQTTKCHVTTVLRSRLQFAVHVWTAGRASSGKWLTARFFATKNCTTSQSKHEIAFYIRLRCVCWIFGLESMYYSCFLGDKSDALRLDEEQHGGTKQWTGSSVSVVLI